MSTIEQSAVVKLEEVDGTEVLLVGGKGAQLGRLTGLRGIDVPPGFVVTTAAYQRAVAADQAALPMPDDVASAIRAAVAELGTEEAYAVRSSAMSEDAADASYAGQHDSFLDVVGVEAVLDHVRRCWASLSTDRAMAYREERGGGRGAAEMAVIVQRMVPADAAGVLFTADPISGNRTVVAIEAVRGLGDALVSGKATPDRYRVRSGGRVEQTLADCDAVLTDAQIDQLAALGRRVEGALGCPQDIEWCLVGDAFSIVQARPITTLFPVPDPGDEERHVYVSVGHQQMMTDPMKPLGLALWQMTAMPVMHEAGGRLFVDVAQRLAVPAARAAVVAMLGKGDPLIGDAIETLIERDFIPAVDEPDGTGPAPPRDLPAATPIANDPSIVDALIAEAHASLAAVERDIAGLSGPALFDFVEADIEKLKRLTFDPRSLTAIMAGMDASWWLNDHVEAWLGEKHVADILVQSAPGNVTSEMGLALLDVADAVRPHPAVVAFLDAGVGDDVLDALPALPGGREARDAIERFLTRYGVRCVGEIDITRPRWREQPSALVPSILGNVRAFAPGEGPRRFEQGRREAEAKAAELVERLRALPDGGPAKADETAEVIERLRIFSGYREFPKFGIVSRLFLYKQALLAEAERLVAVGALRERDECFWLRLEEFRAAACGEPVDVAAIEERQAAFRIHQRLTPPRVLTSEGEAVVGSYRRDDLPPGAIPGLAVSSGTVEGRARIVHDLAGAVFAEGDILVTAFTDPSWTPAFLTIAGLVAEVGGLMTHGAVIAREYGLPAVVGVEGATRLIREGQRIRVHGTDGFVELLD